MSEKIFEVGKPIPTAWLYMELDVEDKRKYIGGVVIKNDKELNRLVDKYLCGTNEEGIMVLK